MAAVLARLARTYRDRELLGRLADLPPHPVPPLRKGGLGGDVPGRPRQGAAVHRYARRGMARTGGAWSSTGWLAGPEVRALGTHARHGQARRGRDWLGEVRPGKAWRGGAWSKRSASGTHPGSSPGCARLGMATQCWARQGSAVRGMAREVRSATGRHRGSSPRRARLKAWRGMAGPGGARIGKEH